MVTRTPSNVHPTAPKPPTTKGFVNNPPSSAGWRPSQDRERLGPGVWIGGFVLMVAILALMAALFGVA